MAKRTKIKPVNAWAINIPDGQYPFSLDFSGKSHIYTEPVIVADARLYKCVPITTKRRKSK